MSRVIKFRAYIDGKMLPWWPEFFSAMSPVTGYGSEFPKEGDANIELMQFTGLQDKHGVEIYEGDVVKVWYRGWNDGGMGDKEVNRVVEFGGGTFENAFTRDKGGIEIIGNIYENHELLTK